MCSGFIRRETRRKSPAFRERNLKKVHSFEIRFRINNPKSFKKPGFWPILIDVTQPQPMKR